MVRVNLRIVLFLALLMGALYLFSRWGRPTGAGTRLLRSVMLGFALLLGWNLLAPASLTLGVNPLSGATAGLLGLPGLCLLLVLKAL